jgi:hypothetical protein
VDFLIRVLFLFRRGTYFDFALVFPDLRLSQVNYQSRKIGTTVAGQKVNSRLSVLLGFRIRIRIDLSCWMIPNADPDPDVKIAM